MNTNKLFLWLVCWLVPMGLASAQSLTATGIIRDAGQKTPLSGVAVVETGTTNGTISDAEGRFRLRVASP
ncbi:MAG: CarboxypepD reg-like domain, partial [Bacteroidota bacterium]